MTFFQDVRKGLIPARLTVAEVYALTAQGAFDGDDAFELIEGEIVPTAAAKASPHEKMKSRLNRALVLQAPEGLMLNVEASVTLSDVTLVEPDLALWPEKIGCEDVRGPELALVVEVANSSLGYDLRVKSRLYALAGVPEYWVVDAVRRTIRVHRVPNGEVYADVEEYGPADEVHALTPGVSIRLEDLD
jgi:Uma2 family endonuclease